MKNILIFLIYVCFSITFIHAGDSNTTDSNTTNNNTTDSNTTDNNTSSNTQENNTSIRIMPLGDSITYDYKILDHDDPRPPSRLSGYRNHLWYMLEEANYGADFVGSRKTGWDITPPFDGDNEGHPGWTSFDIAANTHNYMMLHHPDIVLLHIGTNDNDTIIGGVNTILNKIDTYERESGKSIRVFVALILDERSGSPFIPLFNENLRKLIQTRMIDGDHLTLVNMYRDAGLTREDYIDRIHPNDAGYRKMATVWFNALMAPYTPELYTFPHTLVDSSLVESLNVDEAAHSVTFVTQIPDSGIVF